MSDINVMIIVGCTLLAAVNIVQFIRSGRPATIWLAVAWLMLMGFWLFQLQLFAFGAGMFLIFGLAAQFMPMITKQPETIIEDRKLRLRLALSVGAVSLIFVLVVSVMYHNALKNRPRPVPGNNQPTASIFREKGRFISKEITALQFNIPNDLEITTSAGKESIARGKHDGDLSCNDTEISSIDRDIRLSISIKQDNKRTELVAYAGSKLLTSWLAYGLVQPEASGLKRWSTALPAWRKAFDNAIFSGMPASPMGDEMYDIKLEKAQYTVEFSKQKLFFSVAPLPVSNNQPDKLLVRVSNLRDIEGNLLPDALVFTIPTTTALLPSNNSE